MSPTENYTIDSFLEKVSANPYEIFQQDEQRPWLKVYLMIANDDWQEIFQSYNLKKMGEMYQFKMHYGSDNEDATDYYVYELEKGLLMFFTMSKREEYNKTLERLVKRNKGITPMWLPPKMFEEIISFIVSTYEANIYAFTSRRAWSSQHPAKIRHDFSRLIHYSGDDAGYSLKEMKEMYGVLPSSVDLNIDGNKIRITNDGLFLIRNIDRRMLRIIEEVIEKSIVEQRRLRYVSKHVSQKLTPLIIGGNKFNIVSLMSGKILFSAKLDTYMIDKLFDSFQDEEYGHTEEGLQLPNFSFMDTNVKEGSVTYSATVTDEDKGTIFGISGNEQNMILIPKHNTTFESFINFYRLVNEMIDDSSTMQLFSEGIVNR